MRDRGEHLRATSSNSIHKTGSYPTSGSCRSIC